jgi:hypothetical protein
MKLTRREFLKTTAALAAVGILPGQSSPASTAANHRIVRVHHPLASYFDVIDFQYEEEVPESYYGNFANQELVYGMFDAALGAFTGEPDPIKAMRQLVPYQPGERVFIKINNTTTYGLWQGDWNRINWDLHYNDMDAIAEPINATVRALVRIGVPQEMIGIGDATWSEGSPDSAIRTPRLTPNRLARKIKAAFPGVVLYRSSYQSDGNGITWASNDRHAVVEFRDPLIDRRKERVTSHRLPDQLINAAHMINIPIMKRHNSAGVTGAFKNNFGTIASCAYFHAPLYPGGDKIGAMNKTDANPAVDIWLNPHVGAKTRLIVCDGIFAGWNWGMNPPLGWKQFGGRSPNCLLLGADPVAMDSVIYDQVTASLPDKVSEFPGPNMLVDAAKIGLGTFETQTSPQAAYKSIDYVEINQKFDAAKLQKFRELRTQHKTRLKGALRDLIQQCQSL